MEKKQKWKKIEDKSFELARKAQNYQNLVKRIRANYDSMRSNETYAHLLDLNARGTHLSDPIYQKLSRNYLKRDTMWANNSYINDALVRIGNRTMTQEEYEILKDVSDEKIVDWDLDERLKDLRKKLDKKKSPKGGVSWMDGPFYCHRLPRNLLFLGKKKQKSARFSNTLPIQKYYFKINKKSASRTLRKIKDFPCFTAFSGYTFWTDNSTLTRNAELKHFSKFFATQKTLKCSVIFPALTSSREKSLHLEPFGLFKPDVIRNITRSQPH